MDIHSTVTLRSGAEMPVMGLGTWKLKRDTAGAVKAALDHGYRMIDTSGDYGTQPGVGEAVRRSGLPREEVFLVTKVEETDDSYEKTKADLRELGQDYADLMLIHRPPDDGPGVELWRGLIRARDEGLTRDIGVSNYSTEQIGALIDATGEVPSVNQIEWTPFGHSDDMRNFCREQGIVIQAYSPLTRTERLNDPELKKIAERYGRAPAQIMLRWDLQTGAVPLPKANRIEHQKENLGAFDFELSDEDVRALDAMNERYSALGELPY